jgi:hypothetical protein
MRRPQTRVSVSTSGQEGTSFVYPSPVSWPTVITAIVAIYGALLSTWNAILNWKVNRRRLRVEVTRSFVAVDNPTLMILLKTSNPGHRSLMLRDAGFVCPKGLYLIAPKLSGEALLPHELKEGNGCAFWVDPSELAELLRRNGKSGTVRIKAYFEDSLGKRHYSNRFYLNIQEEISRWSPKDRESR